ncbi:unnamed protein product [Gongylonema pulchrum]|uniref:non-specific serine/threonine protein kinase n=1 Tax=Gongylonema pulchrum TaxID=637853 RepID=A0A3P7MDL7_9BILA|nr:unnamed protein product [Gongylonema pulchrum]
MQCLEAIEELHRIGFIHRDIKPSNFTTGRSSLIHGVRKIYLIDFGFSFQYVDSNDRVKRLHKNMSFKGTMRYAALASHLGRPPSRRDDLESWMYQQVELTKGVLPWKNAEDELDIISAKESVRTNDGMHKLMRACPKSYVDIMKYIASLHKRSRPDYDYIYKVHNLL